MTIGLLLEENRMRWTGPHSCQWTACPSLSPHFPSVNITLTGPAVCSGQPAVWWLCPAGLWSLKTSVHSPLRWHSPQRWLPYHLGVFKTFPGLCSYQNLSYRSSRGLLRDWWTIGFWMVAQDNGFYSLAYGTGSLLWRYDCLLYESARFISWVKLGT